jgi:hypothetical protein
MDLLIFDMDGVLLKPNGYHRALKETVRQAGISTGFGEVILSDKQIAQFESAGVSSEWHSSALCMAFMELESQKKNSENEKQSRQVELNLKKLFTAISAKPLHESTISRGMKAIQELAAASNCKSDQACFLVGQSESIRRSPTMRWFQELVLGSERFTRTYNMKSQFETESYLELYDEPLLYESLSDRILQWIRKPGHGASIMTRRPSKGTPGSIDATDAEIGAQLVGLERLPIAGYGEMYWIAEQTGLDVGDLAKPAWEHALVAVLLACGWPLERALANVGISSEKWELSTLQDLNNSNITVFEDTPGGMIAVQKVDNRFKDIGLQVNVRKIGIAKELSKRSALTGQGAIVFPDINQALLNIDNF